MPQSLTMLQIFRAVVDDPVEAEPRRVGPAPAGRAIAADRSIVRPEPEFH